jgi:hypothetical protein
MSCIKRDMEPIDVAWVSQKATVAEVKAKQIGIAEHDERGCRVLKGTATSAGSAAGSICRKSRLATPEPTADSRSRNARGS